VQTLFADVAALDIDVKANTAAMPPYSTVTAGSVSAPISSAANSVILGTQACKQVTIQNPVGGVTITYGGDATKTDCTMVLAGGNNVTIPVSNVNKIYVISTGAAQTVNWLALA
jgi:hypothetical protein